MRTTLHTHRETTKHTPHKFNAEGTEEKLNDLNNATALNMFFGNGEEAPAGEEKAPDAAAVAPVAEEEPPADSPAKKGMSAMKGMAKKASEKASKAKAAAKAAAATPEAVFIDEAQFVAPSTSGGFFGGKAEYAHYLPVR